MIDEMVEDMIGNFCERWGRQGETGRVQIDELEEFFGGFLREDLNTDAQDGSVEAVARLLAAL